MLPEVAFDESGNTGADLLNVDQPVFVLASTSVTREEAEDILAVLSTHQAKEAKFNRLRKTGGGRRRLCEVLVSPLLAESRAITTVFHKRFMVMTKIVDLLVESVLHNDGIDLYRDGANIGMSNMLFMCAPHFCGTGRLSTFQRRFVEMFRERSNRAIRRFYSSARALYENSSDAEFASSLAPILLSARIIPDILRDNDRNSLDPAIPAFVEHCALWGDAFGASFELVHDDSKPIFESKSMLENLLSRGEKEQTIGYDRRKFVFPLRARGVNFARSEDDPRIQVADLLASSTAYWARGLAAPEKRCEFWQQLNGVNLDRFIRGLIWPGSEVTPAELDTVFDGGVNAVNHISEFLRIKR